MEKSRALGRSKPPEIQRDSLEIIEALRHSLKTQYFLVIKMKHGIVSGSVISIDKSQNKATIKGYLVEVDIRINDILRIE